jgi:hypothetical protein
VSAWLFAAVFTALPAFAQDRLLYVNREHRFAVIFPGQPMARDIAYTTRMGDSVPAREYFIERDEGRYSVTIVELASGRSEDRRSVEHAAANLRRRGEILFQAYANYDPGIPGRQLNIRETNGRQLRASVYMYDHRLYVTEASAVPGDLAAIQFEQSIMLLEADGTDADVSGIRVVFAVIGDMFSRILPD